jgi:eukaryotic-like serine/threonine-protein kinase
VACPTEDSILGFIEGRLTPDERDAIESHAGTCPACERLVSAALAAGSRTVNVAHESLGPAAGLSPTSLNPGTSMGRYTVLSLVGQGGMGDVYAAYDPKLDRKIALKLLRPREAGADLRREIRLMREAQAIARLSHPNVVTVFDVGTFGDRTFVAMEYVAGQTLSGWMQATTRTRAEIVAVFTEAARGLAAAHAAGLVHRDFKPQNVMVGDDGSVRVTDFGLARRVGAQEPLPDELAGAAAQPAAPVEQITQTGELLGTPLYMAPEQFRGKPTDARTDQFSFCVALYQALYREHPFSTAQGFGRLMADVVEGSVRSPPPRSAVPPRLRRALLRGLAPDPASRWPSMQALTAALASDNRRTLRPWMYMAGVAAIVAVAAAARVTKSPGSFCQAGLSRLADTWSVGKREALQRGFLATGVANADETMQRAGTLLDRYADGWLRMYRDACEATHMRGEQSSDVLDLRMSCIEERHVAMQALVDRLMAADQGTVASAVDAVIGLPTLDRCANVDMLRAVVAPPSDPTVRARVADIQRRAAAAKASHHTGHHQQALNDVRTLAAEARTVGYPSLLAEVLLAYGEFLAQPAFDASFDATMREAVMVALRAKRDDLAAEGAAFMGGIVTEILGRPDEGGFWLDLAEALLDRMGPGHDLIRSWILNSRAMQPRTSGTPLGVQLSQQAVDLKRKLLPSDHPDIALSLLTHAEQLHRSGMDDRALAIATEAQQTFVTAYGPSSPFVAEALSNRGEYLRALKRAGDALPLFRDALARWEPHVGPENRVLAYPLTGMGHALIDLDQPEAAVAPLERALRLRAPAQETPPALRGQTCFALARALWATGQRARAIALAKEAHALLVKVPDERQTTLEVADWLTERRR